METRTSHLFVGVLILAIVAGLVVFVTWTVKRDVNRAETRIFYTYFTGSVSGLSTASEVRYRGIPIGAVNDIRIDPEDVERIRVTLEVGSDVPIKEDSVATVELQGITGVSFVQISGGSNQAADLVAKPGKKIPVIASRRGAIEALFAGTPELINRILVLVENVTLLFDEKNRDAIGSMLAHLEILSGTLAANSGNVDLFVQDAALAATELRDALGELKLLARETRGNLGTLSSTATGMVGSMQQNIDTISGDMGDLIADLRVTSQSLTRTSDEIGGVVAEAREPLRDFSEDGLYDLTRLVSEMRSLVASLSRIAQQLESDAPGFLFGGAGEGFEAE